MLEISATEGAWRSIFFAQSAQPFPLNYCVLNEVQERSAARREGRCSSTTPEHVSPSTSALPCGRGVEEKKRPTNLVDDRLLADALIRQWEINNTNNKKKEKRKSFESHSTIRHGKCQSGTVIVSRRYT